MAIDLCKIEGPHQGHIGATGSCTWTCDGTPELTYPPKKVAKYHIEVSREGLQFDHIYAQTRGEAATAAEAISLMVGIKRAAVWQLSDFRHVVTYECGKRTEGPSALRRQFALDSSDRFEV